MPVLTEQQSLIFKFWLPPLLAGTMAGILLLLVGNTPLVRAGGLAVVVVGMAATLRRFGAVLSLLGGLTLCLSPAFWSQTGGGEGNPATIVIAIGAAIIAVGMAVVVSKRPYIGIGIGVAIFAVLFFSQIGTPRSIRLTAFVVSWLMYLVLDMLLMTNPHPTDDAPPILLDKPYEAGETPREARPYHTWGILLLFGVGVLNDPLLVFLAPALVLALGLTRVRLSIPYWVLFGILIGIGVRGFAVDYVQNQSYALVLEQWRYANRWIELVNLIIKQFTPIGVILSVLGLARLARWYPPIGTVTLAAFAAYSFFGLIYVGARREALLLPLLLVQIVWMVYAIFTLGEWLNKTFPITKPLPRVLVLCGFAILPTWMLISILNA